MLWSSIFISPGEHHLIGVDEESDFPRHRTAHSPSISVVFLRLAPAHVPFVSESFPGCYARTHPIRASVS